jgi:hypothetical protein
MPSITTTAIHDDYKCYWKIWRKMRDSFQGEEHIKDRSLEQNRTYLNDKPELKPITSFDQYLRPTDSMRRLGSLGYQRFCDYIYRAKFYPFPEELKAQSLGLIENEPSTFELPTQLEFMLEDSTVNNESLAKVLSITNTEQLEVSRIGLLLNPSAEEGKPFNIGFFKAETIVDWNEVVLENSEKTLDWVKLLTDECASDYDCNHDNRSGTYSEKPVYLILQLIDGVYSQYKTTNANVEYGDSVELELISDSFVEDSFIQPMEAENALNEIPFVIINTTRLGVDVERPFLESITDAALSLYRASAHHEDAAYWGGESTLFTKGYGITEDEPNIYVGNGASNKTSAEYADAKIVTMGTDGIEPRKAIRDSLFEYCVTLGVDLLNKGTESGTALNIRSSVKTASLRTLALTGALGLQTLLRIGAKWLGVDPETVIITANTQFADIRYTADDFVKFSTLVNTGAMRDRDLFQLQKKQNLTTAGSYEDWKDEVTNENNTENNVNTE